MPLLNLTRAVKPDGKNSFPDLPTSEKLLAEELGQKVEEMCTLKRDIDVPQLQVHAKRRRPSFLQDQCIAVSGRLAKVQKDILGQKAPSPVGTCSATGCKVCRPRTEKGASAASQTPPGPPS